VGLKNIFYGKPPNTLRKVSHPSLEQHKPANTPNERQHTYSQQAQDNTHLHSAAHALYWIARILNLRCETLAPWRGSEEVQCLGFATRLGFFYRDEDKAKTTTTPSNYNQHSHTHTGITRRALRSWELTTTHSPPLPKQTSPSPERAQDRSAYVAGPLTEERVLEVSHTQQEASVTKRKRGPGPVQSIPRRNFLNSAARTATATNWRQIM
jgi:hypothetical protein